MLEVLTESQGGSSLAREMECCDWTGLNLVAYTRETERRGGVAPGRKTEAPLQRGNGHRVDRTVVGTAETTGPVLGGSAVTQG